MSYIKTKMIILKALSKKLHGYNLFYSFLLTIYIYIYINTSKINFSQNLLKYLKSYSKNSNITLRYQSNED